MKLGVLGGGQLARMLALAAHPLGVRCIFLDPAPDACAAPLGEHICAPFDDTRSLERLARSADCVTFESENVPYETVGWLAERAPLSPSPRALAAARDRLIEKQLFCSLGIPTPAFVAVDSHLDLTRKIDVVGLPCVLKTRTQGYDGKGQTVLRNSRDIATAFDRIGHKPAILEQHVDFSRELSIIAVRAGSGEKRFYALSENLHREGVLRVARNRDNDPCQAQAEAYATRLLDTLDYVGILALELFEVNGELLANEFAPRVHNSGHWTIEGAQTSQFENHVRAVLGLPLGDTHSLAASAMVNLIGSVPHTKCVLELPGAHLHVYGKTPLPGRKLGHVTLRGESSAAIEQGLPIVMELAAGPIP